VVAIWILLTGSGNEKPLDRVGERGAAQADRPAPR